MGVVQSDAFHAHRLLVLLAVQLQGFQVQVADCVTGLNGFRSFVRLFKEGLAGATERTIGDGLVFLTLLPADGTLFAVLKIFLQTLPTEAVGAGQQHRVPEYALAYRAGQLLLER